MSNFRTTLISSARLVESSSDSFKTLAASLTEKYGIEIKPQIDLLYVESCLVSVGELAGINDNDDIFFREEAWAARHTPLLKPANWQHNEKDILGVVYSVQAKDLNGEILDFDQENVPDCEFELWTEAVVFKLAQPARANEIEKRAKAGNLFVSMEAYFDDYDYALYDKKLGVSKVIARNEDTSFLETHLRVKGGKGQYENQKLGRILRSITFGGFGFVDKPANKRSIITNVTDLAVAGDDEKRFVELLREILNKEDSLMTASASNSVDPDSIKKVVVEAVQDIEAQKAEAARIENLKTLAETLATDKATLEKRVGDLTETVNSKDAELSALKNQISTFDSVVNELMKQESIAGATSDTPPEIVAIDNAKSGEDAFKAKMSFIGKGVAALAARAKRADELEAELSVAAVLVRENEVRAMFNNVLEKDEIEALVAKSKVLTDEEYSDWRDEKELFALALSAAKKPPMDPKQMEADKAKKAKKPAADKSAGPACGTMGFADLISKRRAAVDSPAEGDDPAEMTPLNNAPSQTPNDVKSGVNPGDLRVPKNKIAGSAAGNDPSDALDNVEAEKGVNLAGASATGVASSDERNICDFKALAALVIRQDVDTKDDKPNFDPIS